jgi:putative modified peptide
VSRYAVNSLLYRLKKDAGFRARFTADPAAALAGADLSADERSGFVVWNPRALNELGGSLHLLMSIPGFEDH